MPEYPTTHRGPEHGPAEMPAGRLTAAELLQRETTIDEPVAAGRGFYRLLAAAAGIALIMASGAALASPRVERELPATGVLEQITGPGALRPDLINTTEGLALGERPGRAPDAAATGTAPAGTPSAGDATTGTGERTDPSAEPVPDRMLNTVTSFYQQVVTDPAGAYELLGPGMRGSGYAAFAASWSDVERVTVDSIRSDGPGAAVVTVVVEHVDGAVLRSVQRLMVTAGDPPRIESARLFSAAAA